MVMDDGDSVYENFHLPFKLSGSDAYRGVRIARRLRLTAWGCRYVSGP